MACYIALNYSFLIFYVFLIDLLIFWKPVKGLLENLPCGSIAAKPLEIMCFTTLALPSKITTRK